MLLPHVGQAVVSLFSRLDVPLAYPMEQTCCGQPAFNAGYASEARAVAAHFATVFREYDWIVVPSGSCAAMARVFYEYMDSGSDAAAVGARVFELSEFLVDVIGVVDVGARFARKVTYHDGCHARRELRSSAAATSLLRAVRDIEYIELPAGDECCGFGGTFSVKFGELSASMGETKCLHVRSTGADVLVSGDSSCLLHIGGLLERSKDPIRTMHLAEVLAST
jgi:L-lactate dehydrogenase complex protein LldE